MFEGFVREAFRTSGGANITYRRGGSGPPLLLLHGNPQTHVIWHRMAPTLAQRWTVVAADLRGYGDSTGPGDPDRPIYDAADYTFRAMAQDMVEVMESLGHRRFLVCGHDRGARVTHRMALDSPDRVIRAAVLDILPTRHVWENISQKWAMDSWHWVFMPETSGLAEAMLEAVPPDFFMARKIGRPGIGLDIFAPEALAEYVRCFTPKTVRGSCADYRAAATIDLEHDRADAHRRLAMPLLALWGVKSHTQTMYEDPLTVWRDYAEQVEGHAVVSGHYLAEQAPEECLRHLVPFLAAA